MCGACCGTYRVLFSRTETQPSSLHVPKELTEKVDGETLAMMGTNQMKPRCVALLGKIGKEVGCSIYLNRPSCCREFKPSFEDGQRNPRCDQARQGKGLKPLRLSDWTDVAVNKASDQGVHEPDKTI